MKVKILPLDWYCAFNGIGFFAFGSPEEELIKQTEEGSYNYDGPLHYLVPCDEETWNKIKHLNLPEKPLKFCIKARLLDDKHVYDKQGYWTSDYICFTHQCGKWWKYIDKLCLFSDLYIPYCTYEQSLILDKIPKKFLTQKSLKDLVYWRHWRDLRGIKRSIDRSFLKIDYKK